MEVKERTGVKYIYEFSEAAQNANLGGMAPTAEMWRIGPCPARLYTTTEGAEYQRGLRGWTPWPMSSRPCGAREVNRKTFGGANPPRFNRSGALISMPG